MAYAGLADCYSCLYMYFDNSRSNLEMAQKMSGIAVDLDPDLAEAHTARGFAVSLSQKYREAEDEFKTAIQMNPSLFEAYYFYARTCFAMGRLEEAARLYGAERVKPKDCQSPSLLAVTCRSLGQKEKCEAAYRRTLSKAEKHLELHPDDSHVLYIAATALLELGEQEKGIKLIRKSFSLENPSDSCTAYGMACFHSRVGNLVEAMDYLEQSVHAGFAHAEWIMNDSDLDPIREFPRFRALILELEEKKLSEE